MSKRITLALCAALLCTGCMKALEEQTKSKEKPFSKKTQAIDKMQEGDVKVVQQGDNYVIGSASSVIDVYQEKLVEIHALHVDYAIKLFRAQHDRYPKDYDEFMSQIIKANQIRLPVLPKGMKYAYDEANHKLVVVEDPQAEEAEVEQ